MSRRGAIHRRGVIRRRPTRRPPPNIPLEIFEDFEDASLNIALSGGWARSNARAQTGSWSLKSGPIGHNASIDANVTVPPGALTLQFWYLTSSEATFDGIEFFIDGVFQFHEDQGDAVWRQSAVYDVSAATTVKFRYIKDVATVGGDDAAYIDNLLFVVSDLSTTVSVEPVDITVQPVAVDPARIVDPAPVDITVQLPTPDPAKGVDLAPIDVTVEPIEVLQDASIAIEPVDITVQPVEPIAGKGVDVGPVDTTVQPVGPDLAHRVDLDPIDLTVESVGVTAVTGNTAQQISISITVLPVRPAHLVDVPPVDITTTALAAELAYRIDVPPVNVTVTATPAVAIVGKSAQPLNITVEVLPVEVGRIIDVPPVNIDTIPGEVRAGLTKDIPPVDIAHQRPKVSAYLFDSTPIDIVVTPLGLTKARAARPAPVNIVHQHPTPDLAHLADVPPINITAQAVGINVQSGDFTPVDVEIEILPVTVAFSSNTSAAIRGLPVPVVEQPTRVLARSILTGAWLHMDLPVNNLEITHTLSGPQAITGDFPGEIRDLADAGLEPWGTWIYVEENGQITGSGILQPTRVDTGQKLDLEAIGVSAYPNGIPYQGPDYDGIQVDPADIVRILWNHLQSYPDAKLGVEVLGSTPARIGLPTPPEDVSFETAAGEQVNFQRGGPYTLRWYEGLDCGSEIDSLAKEGPFEYTERSFWNDPITKDFVRQQIILHHPRAGSRRTDLSFAQDENLLAAIGPEEAAGTYASQVILFGKGEGTSKIRGYAGQPVGTRIRRVATVDAKTVDNTVRANALSTEELRRRQALLDITELVAKARHPNARLGSFQVGDDVPIEGQVPWAGYIHQWERILSYTYSPDSERVRVQCRRSESFTYGGSS